MELPSSVMIHLKGAVVGGEPYGGQLGIGVPDNVGQRLGGNAVRGHLDRGWQCRHRLGRLNDHLDRAVPTALLAQCPDQPKLVESGGTQPVDELPYGFDRICRS